MLANGLGVGLDGWFKGVNMISEAKKNVETVSRDWRVWVEWESGCGYYYSLTGRSEFTQQRAQRIAECVNKRTKTYATGEQAFAVYEGNGVVRGTGAYGSSVGWNGWSD